MRGPPQLGVVACKWEPGAPHGRWVRASADFARKAQAAATVASRVEAGGELS